MKQSPYILKIGGEIELGATYARQDLHEDLGIKMNDFKKSICCGEAIIEKPLDDVNDVIKWIEFNYKKNQELPYDFETNNGIETQEMTGTHWHFSFTKMEYYVALMSKDFQKYFIEYLTKWATNYPVQNEYFWERLENRNRFCKAIHIPYDQIFNNDKKPNDKTRYTALNYCYGRFRTIESRVPPTFMHMDTAISCFQAHVDCINSYLNANTPPPFNINEQFLLEVDDDEIIDGDKKSGIIRPFNYFMEKGIVAKGKYGLKELYKSKEQKQKDLEENAKLAEAQFLLNNKNAGWENAAVGQINAKPKPKPFPLYKDVDYAAKGKKPKAAYAVDGLYKIEPDEDLM